MAKRNRSRVENNKRTDERSRHGVPLERTDSTAFPKAISIPSPVKASVPEQQLLMVGEVNKQSW
jgi:hypothetical protein